MSKFSHYSANINKWCFSISLLCIQLIKVFGSTFFYLIFENNLGKQTTSYFFEKHKVTDNNLFAFVPKNIKVKFIKA